MSTSPLDELSEEEQQNLVKVAKTDAPSEGVEDEQGRKWTVQDLLNIGLTRRQALSLMASVASGAVFATALKDAIEPTRADPSTTDNDGDVGTPNDRVDVFSDGVDANVVDTESISVKGVSGSLVHNALAEGYIVAMHTASAFLVDPSTDASPFNTAMDLVAEAANNDGLDVEQRGAVYLPPRTINHADALNPYNFVTVACPLGVCEFQMAADTDGVVWDIANDPYNSYAFFRVDWSDARLVILGQGAGTATAGTGWVENTGHWRSHFGHIEVSQWSVPSGDHLWHTVSGASTFETVYDYIRLDGDAGNSDGMMKYEGGGALKRIGILACNSKTDLSGSTAYVVNSTSFGGTVQLMNLGGPGLDAAWYDTGPVRINMINYEPGAAQPETPAWLVFASGSSTYVRVDHVWIRPNAVVDHVYGQFNGGRNYWGMVDNEGTINTNVLKNNNDTNDTVIYEGPSSEVDDTSGTTLTPPIACLGDLTTVS